MNSYFPCDILTITSMLVIHVNLIYDYTKTYNPYTDISEVINLQKATTFIYTCGNA